MKRKNKKLHPALQNGSCPDRLRRIFYLSFGIVFLFILIQMIFCNNNYDTAYLLPFSALILVILMIIFMRIEKHKEVISQYWPFIFTGFILLLFASNVTLALVLRYTPKYDFGNVYFGAIEWAQTGTFADHSEYFYYFPNNLGGMTFLNIIFRAGSLLGIDDYYALGAIVTSICNVSAMAVTVMICKKLMGIQHAAFAVVLFLLSAPMYTISAFFYTDSLTFLFPVLGFWIYLKAKEENSGRGKGLLFCLMSLVIVIGAGLKATVWIILIAILIDMLFDRKWKEAVFSVLSTVLIFSVLSVSFHGYIYSRHLDPKIADQQNTPYLHWVMMGLKDSGMYNPGDYEFTRNAGNPDQTREAVQSEISRRIREHGYSGMFDLYTKKIRVDYGDGTYNLTAFLEESRMSKGFLFDYLNSKGEGYDKYRHLCTEMQIAVYVFILIGAFGILLHKKNMDGIFALHLAMLGLFLFLMIWESSCRYITNFVPISYICAVKGIGLMVERLKSKNQDTVKVS